MIPHLLAALCGMALLAGPAVLGYGDTARADHIVVGALIGTFGLIAATDATRGVRRVTQLLGLWLIVGGWILGYPANARWAGMVVGALAFGLSCLNPEEPERFAGGWASLFRPGAPGLPGPPDTGYAPSRSSTTR